MTSKHKPSLAKFDIPNASLDVRLLTSHLDDTTAHSPRPTIAFGWTPEDPDGTKTDRYQLLESDDTVADEDNGG